MPIIESDYDKFIKEINEDIKSGAMDRRIKEREARTITKKIRVSDILLDQWIEQIEKIKANKEKHLDQIMGRYSFQIRFTMDDDIADIVVTDLKVLERTHG